MSSILDGELAETISAALLDASVPYDVTVRRITPGEPDPEEPWVPVEDVVTDFPCKGFTESYSETYLATGVVLSGDVKVVVLFPTLSTMPAPGDLVLVRGETYSVVNVAPDPALATLEIQARA
ncbi:hypothetical protein [Breoghania sp.]|uniref:hypothetical protein n=1 Tax=Breoghania sp. TaxID=2065378 RepID=UPI002AA701C8|nr:hypothetical protein [Breoghania sp.]